MKRLLFIYNPRSGKERIKTHLSAILDCFVKNGYCVEVRPTQEIQDARKYIEKHAYRFDRIVCSGGDGTLNEVVTGLMGYMEKPLIGYIPAGSTNDFASSIQLPKNMRKAAQTAMNGTPYSVDIGSMNDRYFTYVAGFGAFTEVSYLTPQEKKNLLGHQAYIIEGIKQLGSLKAYSVTLEHDGEVVEGRFILCMITNSYSVGGFKGLTGKDINMNDGLFEVNLIKVPTSVMDYQNIIGVAIGMEQSNDAFLSFKTSRLVIHSNMEIPWTIDGEFGGNHTEVEIVNHRKAIQIMSGIEQNTGKLL